MNNLNPFASSKNAVATNATEQKMASGSEQERYGSHFGINEKSVGNTVDRMKDAALNATTTKGTGSEQDRFQIHFGIDGEKIKAATKSWIDSSGKSLGLGHGLGYDGQQRAIQLANIQGVGAEQDRYGSHFGLSKQTVEKAANKLHDGAQNLPDRK